MRLTTAISTRLEWTFLADELSGQLSDQLSGGVSGAVAGRVFAAAIEGDLGAG